MGGNLQASKNAKLYNEAFLRICDPKMTLKWPLTKTLGWVASMSIIGTLFVVIKFILYYAKKYKAHKSAEKEFEKVNLELD